MVYPLRNWFAPDAAILILTPCLEISQICPLCPYVHSKYIQNGPCTSQTYCFHMVWPVLVQTSPLIFLSDLDSMFVIFSWTKWTIWLHLKGRRKRWTKHKNPQGCFKSSNSSFQIYFAFSFRLDNILVLNIFHIPEDWRMGDTY